MSVASCCQQSLKMCYNVLPLQQHGFLLSCISLLILTVLHYNNLSGMNEGYYTIGLFVPKKSHMTQKTLLTQSEAENLT